MSILPALKQLYKNKGSLGVLEWIYDKKRFTFIKWFLKTCFYIFPYEEILKTTAKYNENIPVKGFTNSTREYLQQLNILTDRDTPLSITGGALIFGNHPTGLDPFLITSCLNREDIYIVADVYQKNKGNYIGRHIVPIIYARTQRNLNNRGFLNSIGFYVMRLLTGYEAPEQVKIQNEQTVKQAAQLLIDGHIVIIFPDGGSNNPELWYNGIGDILKKTSVEEKDIKLFATQISGISTSRLIRHFLWNKKIFLKKNPIHITLSEPLTMEMLNIKTTDGSHEITERLRMEFVTKSLWAPNYVYNRS